jgi:alpha-tubulin suppressor-like RCC1 family protein
MKRGIGTLWRRVTSLRGGHRQGRGRACVLALRWSLAALVTCLGLEMPSSAMATASKAISAGAFYTCALTSAGGVKCWGPNFQGELGDGTTAQRITPVDVSGLASGVTAISTGGERVGGHTCALTSASGVKCWGYNVEGDLGDGTNTRRTTPVDVSGLTSGVTAISAGGYHTCALTSVGGVKCWGDNSYGQLGDGTTAQRTTPVDVSGLAGGVTAIITGAQDTCALTSAGGVKCWGANFYGQLGDGTIASKTTPVDVAGLTSGVTAISAGWESTCALKNGGGVKCWGENGYGELGDGTTATKTTPIDVAGLTSGVTAISAGSDHTCALTSAGGMKCWGNNQFGELGDRTTKAKTTPVDVSGLASGVIAISAGGGHSCALTGAGGAKCWGGNSSGELGDGTTRTRTTPVNVSGLQSGTCTSNSGSITLSPGVTNTPTTQTMKIKGQLAGCSGDLFTSAKYTATLTTAGPVACSALNEAASGSARYRWSPRAKPSGGTLSLSLSETPGTVFSGEVTTGSYSPLVLSGTATESYGSACGGKAVKKGTFSGSTVSFE